MHLLQRVAADRRKLLAAMLLIFLLATFVRLYNIGWSFSNNGVDEGIMLVRARMLDQGFDLYSEIPCDQAPLALLVCSALEGDVLASRLLSAVLSIAAIAVCMEAAKRTRGETAMLATGLVLAVDFAFLRESRLFSLDGMSSYFLAFSLLPLLSYVRGGSRAMLVASGLLLGLSAASKLYGAMAILGVLVFLLWEHAAGRKKGAPSPGKALDALLLLIASALPLSVLLVVLGPSEVLEGMILNQGHRGFDIVMKLSVLLLFAFNVAYVLPLAYARALWSRSPEARVLLCVSFVLLANFVLQPLAFLHNIILMSPPLAILVGLLVVDVIEREKNIYLNDSDADRTKRGISAKGVVTALFLAGIVVSAGLASYGLAVQGRSPQQTYGERIASWTSEDDWIISGDPLIAAYAERNVPLDMINMGTRIFPEITLGDVEAAVTDHGVAVVVVCYRLLEDDMAGLPAFLEGNGYLLVSQEALGEWATAAIDTDANERPPLVYVDQDIVTRLGLPVA